MQNLYNLDKVVRNKTIKSLLSEGVISRYEYNVLLSIFDNDSMNNNIIFDDDNMNYNIIHHYDEIELDGDIIDHIMNSKCGYGHDVPYLFKRTNVAVSYGIIVFVWDSNEQMEYYLVTQRRDSIPYTDLVLGRYKLEYLPRYFTLMTKKEREIIANYNFDDIWDDMFVINKPDIKNENRARKSWYRLQSQGIIQHLLNTTESNIEEPEWEFPKGRKTRYEDHIECAMREFEEEANVERKHLIVLNRKPFIDTFYGSNDKVYQSIYFPALMKKKILPKKTYYIHSIIRNSFVNQEISNVKWVSFNELHNYIDKRKYNMIKDEFRPWLLQNINNDGFMRCGVRKSNSYPFRMTA